MIENLHEQLNAAMERMHAQFPSADVRVGFEVQWTKDYCNMLAMGKAERFCVGVAMVSHVAHEYGFGVTLAEAETNLLKNCSPDFMRQKAAQMRADADKLERSLGIEVAK